MRARSSAADADAALEDDSLDAVVTDGQIRSKDEPDDELVTLLQSANREVEAAAALEQAGVSDDEAQRALAPPPLQVSTIEPIDEEEDGKAGVAFFAILILYGQLLTYGYWVAAGVVEEKASRVVEVILSTIRPKHLLAGKVIGIGLLGLGEPAADGGHRARGGAGDRRARRRRRRSSAPPRSRWRGSWSATRSTPAPSPARARWCRARRSCSRR